MNWAGYFTRDYFSELFYQPDYFGWINIFLFLINTVKIFIFLWWNINIFIFSFVKSGKILLIQIHLLERLQEIPRFREATSL